MSFAIDTLSASFKKSSVAPSGLTLLDELLLEQQTLLATPVAEFSEHYDAGVVGKRFSHLMPLTAPKPGEQYAFEVNLDACTGCKACVAACHSLNGLDDDESWRDVGTLASASTGYSQTVTTACHHCADPACANGCPVLAYDKDEATGIVKHLDDQCIGCSYCQMKCPYDVPKWNVKRGIVRKCDMCQGRLAVGEAPACVQACPNGAIKIRVVAKSTTVTSGSIVPGAFDSGYTGPTTRYLTEKTLPLDAEPADAGELRLSESHGPLAWMLVLTQMSVGALAAGLLSGLVHLHLSLAVVLTGAVGVGLSTLHLGQPLKAWRAFLGWRRSWLSREIMAFGAYVPLCAAAVIYPALGWLALLAGLAALGSSVMVYVDTRRAFWAGPLVVGKFVGTSLVLGFGLFGAVVGSYAAAVTSVLSLCALAAWETLRVNHRVDAPWAASIRIMNALQSSLLLARWSLVLASLLALPIFGAWVVLGLGLAYFAIERHQFFTACAVNRMPGN